MTHVRVEIGVTVTGLLRPGKGDRILAATNQGGSSGDPAHRPILSFKVL